MFFKTIFIHLLVIFNILPCYAYLKSTVKKQVNEANRLYNKGRFDEALKKYEEAIVNLPDSDIVNFNIGATLYKKGKYLEAEEAFTRALASNNKQIEADALYNIGNCKYKLGKIMANEDLSKAIELMKDALDYYRQAIEVDSKKDDARFNFEFVEKELEALLDKLKSQDYKDSGDEGIDEQKDSCEKDSLKGNDEGSLKDSNNIEKSREELKEEKRIYEMKEGRDEGNEDSTKSYDKELTKEEAMNILEHYGKEEALPDYMRRVPIEFDEEAVKDW
ncbi:MAG: tetratricopeptide repeat protein [Candidatus Omnitrophica bacterium]|nr:tetratricopeptide repeat protein [Candidatus Omnitrophota bacterium]MCM8826301.1 tetratricopeptide repeat protein [Candidatus Omnitrophota bacterium]